MRPGIDVIVEPWSGKWWVERQSGWKQGLKHECPPQLRGRHSKIVRARSDIGLQIERQTATHLFPLLLVLNLFLPAIGATI